MCRSTSLAVVAFTLATQPAAFAAKVYWLQNDGSTGQYAIRRANLDGSNVQTVVALGSQQVNGIAVDPINQTLYWTQYERLRRSDLDGSNVQTVLYDERREFQGVKVDGGRNLIAWSQPEEIWRMDLTSGQESQWVNFNSYGAITPPFSLDTSTGGVYWSNPESSSCPDAVDYRSAVDLVVDSVAQQLYWVSTCWVSRGIHRLDLQQPGAESVRLADPVDPLAFPTRLALDSPRGKLYWTAHDGIFRMNIDGSGVESFIPMPGNLYPMDLSIDSTAEAPFVQQVRVGGLTAFRQEYALPVGSDAQLKPLPWSTVKTVSIVFSEDVALEENTASLTGKDGQQYPLFGPVIGIGPTPGTMNATWILDTAIGIDHLTLRLPDTVVDNDGDRLDGEWTDGVSVQSGDGVPGGDFVFRFDVLPGDVNQDRVVNVLDWAEVRDRLGTNSGNAEFSIFHDVDRRGSVDAADFYALPIRHIFTSLPETVGEMAQPVPEPSSSVVVLVALALCAVVRFARSTPFLPEVSNEPVA